MKPSKPTSFTVDTEHSPTHMFQSQLLSKTNLSTLSQDPARLQQIFNEPENKQSLFLRTKNQQLQDKVKRLEQKVEELQKNKIYLLQINEKYVQVLNRYYCDLNDKNTPENFKTSKNSRESSSSFEKQNKKSEKKSQKRPVSCQKDIQNPQDKGNAKRLEELQKDHRNLTRHCLVMQNEIKNYAKQMQKFSTMKSELKTVNHTSPKELILELQEVVKENKMLKRENNRLGFELEKVKLDLNKLNKAKENQKKLANVSSQEIEKLKSQVNKVVQESKDKSDKYEQRIYELELKVEKLQKQLRSGQQAQIKLHQRRKSHQISRVEDVLENNYLKTNLSEILDPKKHLLLSTNNIFFNERIKKNSSTIEKRHSTSLPKKTSFVQ